MGGLSIGLWVHVTMEEDCPGAPKTIPRWTPEGTEVLGVIWCCLWVLELVCVCLGLGVGGWLGHRFLGACGRGGGLPRSTENDPKMGPRAFEKCRKMITKALILGSWAPRRRGLGTYLGRLGPQVERSWNLGPQVDQNSPKNDFITPPLGGPVFDQKSTKSGTRAPGGLKSKLPELPRWLLRFWSIFWPSPGRAHVVQIQHRLCPNHISP